MSSPLAVGVDKSFVWMGEKIIRLSSGLPFFVHPVEAGVKLFKCSGWSPSVERVERVFAVVIEPKKSERGTGTERLRI